MITFRVDNRSFQVGDIVFPQSIYQHKLNETRLLVEQILEDNRPSNKPPRNSILMLFTSFNNALRHWTHQSGSKFYRTCISENDILHVGDYNKVEELFQNINDLSSANEIASDYWNGIITNNPIEEVFVNSSIIVDIISNLEKERKNEFARGWGLEDPNIRRIIDN